MIQSSRISARVRRVASVLVFLLATTVVRADTGIRVELVSSEGGSTTALVDPRDGTGRLFIVKRLGQILILEDGNVLPTPFLDLSNNVSCCELERGMTSLAFHPDYETNGRFFVGYVNNNLETVVSRFTVSADPSRADAASERELLSWAKIGRIHHGGILAFAPNGYLYVANGDGDNRPEAQDLGTFPGTILRLDVDRGSTYRIPPDNPFRNTPGVLPEIWAWGLRNPWRISFDRETGDLFIGDVGGTLYEEVNFASASSEGGLNYGWPIKEAEECLKSEKKCADPTLVDPIIQYPHDPDDDQCNSVIGGYFYRGPEAPTLYGTYIYGDFCTGQIWGARRNSAGEWITNKLLDTDLNITTFAESESGVLYVGDFPGAVYRVVGQELFASGFESGDTRDWSESQGDLEVVRPGLGRSARALEVPVDGSATKRFRALQ